MILTVELYVSVTALNCHLEIVLLGHTIIIIITRLCIVFGVLDD